MWLLVLLAVILLVASAGGSHSSGSAASSSAPMSSQGCTGSQTVTAHEGDDLTVLVETHVSGSYDTQKVVDIAVDMNDIGNRNLIYANQQYRLPVTCSGP
jgi:hypothetical protein